MDVGLAVAQSFRTPFALGDMQPAVCSRYVALPFVRMSVGIWQTSNLTGKPVELEGHTSRVSALRFGFVAGAGTLLVSAGNDYLLLWNVDECVGSARLGSAPRGRILASVGGSCSDSASALVSWIALDSKCELVAACIEWTAHVWDIKSKELVVCLEGHDGRVTCAEFVPYCARHVLATGSEDRTFKLWNIGTREVLYQSAIMSPSPFTCMSINVWDQELVLGTGDGSIFFVELPKSVTGVRCTRKLDVNRALCSRRSHADSTSQPAEHTDAKVLSSRPSWQQLGAAAADPGGAAAPSDLEAAEAADVILSVHFTRLDNDPLLPPEGNASGAGGDGTISHLLNSRILLSVATTTALVFVDARSSDITASVELDSLPSSCSVAQDDGTTPTAIASAVFGCCCFASQDQLPTQVLILLGCLFENTAHLCRADLSAARLMDDGQQDTGNVAPNAAVEEPLPGVISMLSDSPLLPTSPLNKLLTPKPPEQPTKGVSSSKAKSSSKSMKVAAPSALNLPVTVHGKIKSSGYSQTAPQRVLFKPAVNGSKGSSGRAGSNKSSSKGSGSQSAGLVGAASAAAADRTSASAWTASGSQPPPGSVLKGTTSVDVRPTCINSIRFSPNGQHLLCALSNKSAVALRMPLSTSDDSSAVFSGHNGAVTCASWSRDGQYIVTGSADRTAAVWIKGQSDALMEFNRIQGNLKADASGSHQPASEFGAEIRHAQFYYMDRFVLLACGNSLRMYACHLDSSKNDIQRYKERSKYKMASCLTMASAQTITAAAATNEFYSYLVICAGSDRSLEVFDFNVNRCIRTIPDAHARQVHAVCLYEGSLGADASAGSATYDLFLTSALTDGIKLWDLRANRCVARYDHHKCRAVPCGVAWSPCGRYIVTGSEDKTAYVIDLSSGQVVTRLSGHNDAVTSVGFHPHRREVVTGSSDGIVQIYA